MPETMFLHIQSRDSASAKVLPVAGSAVRIGRGPQCEVRLGEPALADVQCLLRRRGATWHVQPVGPPGAVSIEGRAVEAQRPLALGTPLRVGDTWLTLRPAGAASVGPGTFEAPIPVEPAAAVTETRVSPFGASTFVGRDYADPTAVTSRPPPAANLQGEEERLSRWQAQLEQREEWLKTRQDERRWERRWRAVGEQIKARGATPPRPASGPKVSRPVSPRPIVPFSEAMAAAVAPPPPTPIEAPPSALSSPSPCPLPQGERGEEREEELLHGIVPVATDVAPVPVEELPQAEGPANPIQLSELPGLEIIDETIPADPLGCEPHAAGDRAHHSPLLSGGLIREALAAGRRLLGGWGGVFDAPAPGSPDRGVEDSALATRTTAETRGADEDQGHADVTPATRSGPSAPLPGPSAPRPDAEVAPGSELLSAESLPLAQPELPGNLDDEREGLARLEAKLEEWEQSTRPAPSELRVFDQAEVPEPPKSPVAPKPSISGAPVEDSERPTPYLVDAAGVPHEPDPAAAPESPPASPAVAPRAGDADDDFDEDDDAPGARLGVVYAPPRGEDLATAEAERAAPAAVAERSTEDQFAAPRWVEELTARVRESFSWGHPEAAGQAHTASTYDAYSSSGGWDATGYGAPAAARPALTEEDPSLWPRAETILRATRVRSAAKPKSQPAKARPSPTVERGPDQWTLPLWLGWLPTAALAIVAGLGAIGLSWSWGQDQAATGPIADRVLGREALPEGPIADPATLPEPSWWRSSAGNLSLQALAVARAPGEVDADDRARFLLGTARNASPLQADARLNAARAGKPGSPVEMVGLSRDVVALTWSGRQLLQAGKVEAALNAYRGALTLAAASELDQTSVPVFDGDAKTRRFAMPREDLIGPVVRDMADHAAWTYETWSKALPPSPIVALSAYRALRAKESPDAERALEAVAAASRESSSDPLDLAVQAEALAFQERWDEAQDRYHEAIEQMPVDAIRRSWWFNAGAIALRRNDAETARIAWDTARGTHAADPIARKVVDARRWSGLGAEADRPKTAATKDATRPARRP